MKRISILLLTFALGCGGKPASTPSAGDSVPAANQPAANPTGAPNADEASNTIREYFTDPGTGVAFLKVDVEKVSDPVPAPKEIVPGGGEAWLYSVNMTCENVVGDRQHNRNWLILIGRDKGKATVKDHFHDLTKMANSPVGKVWFVQNGFAEPTID